MEAARACAGDLGIWKACGAFALARASYYRRIKPQGLKLIKKSPRKPPRPLSEEERKQVLGLMHSERFMDSAPRSIYATMLD